MSFYFRCPAIEFLAQYHIMTSTTVCVWYLNDGSDVHSANTHVLDIKKKNIWSQWPTSSYLTIYTVINVNLTAHVLLMKQYKSWTINEWTYFLGLVVQKCESHNQLSRFRLDLDFISRHVGALMSIMTTTMAELVISNTDVFFFSLLVSFLWK